MNPNQNSQKYFSMKQPCDSEGFKIKKFTGLDDSMQDQSGLSLKSNKTKFSLRRSTPMASSRS